MATHTTATHYKNNITQTACSCLFFGRIACTECRRCGRLLQMSHVFADRIPLL